MGRDGRSLRPSATSINQKNYYHMKHSSVLVGTHDRRQVPPPFCRQCSLGMLGFQIELQNKLPLYIIIDLCHKCH
jgi:hypothetical protein